MQWKFSPFFFSNFVRYFGVFFCCCCFFRFLSDRFFLLYYLLYFCFFCLVFFIYVTAFCCICNLLLFSLAYLLYSSVFFFPNVFFFPFSSGSLCCWSRPQIRPTLPISFCKRISMWLWKDSKRYSMFLRWERKLRKRRRRNVTGEREREKLLYRGKKKKKIEEEKESEIGKKKRLWHCWDPKIAENNIFAVRLLYGFVICFLLSILSLLFLCFFRWSSSFSLSLSQVTGGFGVSTALSSGLFSDLRDRYPFLTPDDAADLQMITAQTVSRKKRDLRDKKDWFSAFLRSFQHVFISFPFFSLLKLFC